MSRDFHSLDRLRLDKYLFLIRCYVGVGFEIFLKRESPVTTTRLKESIDGEQREKTERKTQKKRKRGEEEDGPVDKAESRRDEYQESGANGYEDLETYLNMLEEGPLCPFNFPVHNEQANQDKPSSSQQDRIEMPKGPDGLRYHLMDIWLDEIARVAAETETTSAPDPGKDGGEEGGEGTRTKLKEGIPIELLLRPMQQLRTHSQNKTAKARAVELFADSRLVEWGVRRRGENGAGDVGNDDDGGAEDEEWQGIDGSYL